jgi:outer membrane protein OmpA-like peptidoglycan-associated protein
VPAREGGLGRVESFGERRPQPSLLGTTGYFDLPTSESLRLDEAAEKLRDNPNLAVEIEGHTDSIGTELYNLGLGQRRAEAVKGYLVLRYQVDSNRMTAVSYGESRPIADNRTAEGRAQNRRVEFKVLIR